MTDQTLTALDAEIERLRAEKEKRELELHAPESTRDRSPAKPQDHKPADADLVTIEHAGVTFTTTRGSLGSLRTLDMLERNQITSALRRVIGDKSFEEFLDKNPDAGAEQAGELLNAIAEKVGAKNS
ncbi:hypothetical protein ACIFOC_00444 [Leucobacter aridicollis]